MFEPDPRISTPLDSAAWKSWLLDWNQIEEPGCYLHLPSGLLARVFRSEEATALHGSDGGSGAAVRLSGDPHTPLDRLREIALENSLPVSF